MIKAVLFDLDDTLLRLRVDGDFVPRYMNGLAHALRSRLIVPPDPKDLMQAQRAGIVDHVLKNLDPSRVNRAVFADHLAAALNVPRDALDAAYADYHASAYLALVQQVVEPVAGAPALAERLFGMNLAVAIATNPLFPLEAVQARMQCAGIDPTLPFAFITNLDESHFTKPHPHYYEEILARIGVEADEAIMVGDSYLNDIVPAAAVGMYTYWVDLGIEQPLGAPVCHGRGTLAGFAEKVEAGWLSTLTQIPLPRLLAAQVFPRMIGDAGALFGLVESVNNPSHWRKRPLSAEWTPLEIVVHLRESERHIQRPRLLRIAQDDNPFIEPPPPPPVPSGFDLAHEDPFEAARGFWAERQITLAMLADLRPDDWTRPARHSIFGRTTLLEMAIFATRHDRLHLTQLCQTLGRCKED